MRATANSPEALRDQLRSVFSRAKVPTNPAIAMEILRLADDPNSTAEQFAQAIRADAALAARLLEMANTAMFAQREPVTTIKRAVTLLGLRRIRMVALGFQLVSHLDRLGGSPFDLKTFWQHSVLRACLAREATATVVPTHAEEAFVIGLLQDCGTLLLVQVLGNEYAEVHASSLTPTAFYHEEKKRFPYDHAEAIHALAQEWNMPDVIAEPLGRHHQPTALTEESSEIDRLAAVSYFVGSLPLAGDLTLAGKEPGLRKYAADQLGLDEVTVQGCLQRAGDAYGQIAPLLADQLPKDLDVTELLDEANRHLGREATEAAARVEEVEAERDLIRDQQYQLKSALGQYRERAARDPLTRLLNRGALVDATLACARDCFDNGAGMAVLFLDIDDFKFINDKYGHHVGDEILRMLADTVLEAIVNAGFAGRYGGEEFVVVLPGLEESDARRKAEQLIEKVRDARPSGDCPSLSITVSIGAVWGQPGAETTPEELFSAADELMYQAKLRGKDRLCFKELPPPADRGASSPDEITTQDFRRIAIELNKSKPKRFASMRKRERQGLLASCDVRCFVSGAATVRTYAGFVRNISTGGLGVLTTRPMLRGEPIEVEIDEKSEQRPLLFLAGLVAFCRHVKDGIYEVGVQLLAQGKEPIIARDATSLKEQQEWVQEALYASHGTGGDLRESA